MKYQFELENLYQALKNARTRAGLTQIEVEKRLGLRSLSIRDFESGRLKLPVEIAARLANLYNTELEQLLGMEFLQKPSSKIESTIIDLAAIGIFKDIKKMEVMLTDPVIRAAIDQHNIEITDTVYDLLVRGLSENQTSQYLNELIKISNTLIAIDGKITPDELAFRDAILERYLCHCDQDCFDKAKKYFYEPYYPQKLIKAFEKSELKHFAVWILFFLAASDDEIDYREEEYILRLSEAIQLSKFNYEFIRDKFKDFLMSKESLR